MDLEQTQTDEPTEKAPLLLVVDDAVDTRHVLRVGLERAGFRVWDVGSAPEALALIRQEGLPDLILLDKMMPEIDGFELARILQAEGDVPIIFLSVQSDAETKAEGIRRYAEDYIIKPFSFPELIARIRRILDRSMQEESNTADVRITARLSVNFADRVARVNREQIALTDVESRLLQLLYNNRGRILSPSYLLHRLWGDQEDGSAQSLWVQIRRLRKKLGDDPDDPHYLITVRGQGYYLPEEQDINEPRSSTA